MIANTQQQNPILTGDQSMATNFVMLPQQESFDNKNQLKPFVEGYPDGYVTNNFPAQTELNVDPNNGIGSLEYSKVPQTTNGRLADADIQYKSRYRCFKFILTKFCVIIFYSTNLHYI